MKAIFVYIFIQHRVSQHVKSKRLKFFRIINSGDYKTGFILLFMHWPIRFYFILILCCFFAIFSNNFIFISMKWKDLRRLSYFFHTTNYIHFNWQFGISPFLISLNSLFYFQIDPKIPINVFLMPVSRYVHKLAYLNVKHLSYKHTHIKSDNKLIVFKICLNGKINITHTCLDYKHQHRQRVGVVVDNVVVVFHRIYFLCRKWTNMGLRQGSIFVLVWPLYRYRTNFDDQVFDHVDCSQCSIHDY